MRAKCVFCEVETKCLSVIYANVSLHDVRITHVFLILVPPDSVCSVGFPDVDPSQSQQRSVSVKIWYYVTWGGDIYFKDEQTPFWL